MEHTMEKKTDIKDYDDRKISFTESRDGDVLLRNLMLSDLTERERNIYFEGVAEGHKSGITLFGVIVGGIVFIVMLALWLSNIV